MDSREYSGGLVYGDGSASRDFAPRVEGEPVSSGDPHRDAKLVAWEGWAIGLLREAFPEADLESDLAWGSESLMAEPGQELDWTTVATLRVRDRSGTVSPEALLDAWAARIPVR